MKGGRDAGCRHIGAPMYSLEALVNTDGKDSVTSGECPRQRRPRSTIKPCEVKDINIPRPVYGRSKSEEKA